MQKVAPSLDLVVVVDIDGDGDGDLADHALTSEHLGQHRYDGLQAAAAEQAHY